MIKSIFRIFGFWGFIKHLIFYPFFVIAWKRYENEQRKIAISRGLSFEEYKKQFIVHSDGTPLTEAKQKQYEAQSRAYKLEKFKAKFRYKNF
ncbi:MAG: hypothetical protein K2H82_06420 [Oscillospiraceae bacterium]|nr:hypothetical protein [Oscillospiraceae bacterium]